MNNLESLTEYFVGVEKCSHGRVYPNFPLKNIFGIDNSSNFSSNKMCLVSLSPAGTSSSKVSSSVTKDTLAACL